VSLYTNSAISTVSTWKNGRIPVSRWRIEKISQLFRVTPAFLIYGISEDLPKVLPGKSIEDQALMIKTITEIEKIFQVQHSKNNSKTVLCQNASRVEKDQKAPEKTFESNTHQTLRQKIEHYIATYLNEVEQIKGGLEHTWFQLLKEFPLDWFIQHKNNLEQK
jgi:hypothetical protein